MSGVSGTEPSAKQRRTAALASAVGTTIEWYDFFIYGLAAGLVFNVVFFPESDPLVGILLAFGTFAVGYIGRPVGALIFGHYGDRIGRKSALVTTMMIMGICTALIGLLPSYASIGVWAPLLLMILRIAQGIAIAGEWGGAVLLAVEYAPRNRRGLYGSWPQIGVPVGLVLSTGVFAVLTLSTTHEQMLAWGWRIPFLFSVVLIVVGLAIRLKLMDSPAFRELKDSGEVAKAPLKELMKTPKTPILLAMGTKWAEGVAFNTWAVFSVSYLTAQQGMTEDSVLIAVTIAAVFGVFFIPLWGLTSDIVGRARVYGVGSVVLALVAFPSFFLFETGSFLVVTLVLIVVFGIAYPLMFAPQGALYSELFDARVRYSGISVVFQFASIVSSGLTPMILTFLLIRGGESPWLICLYIAVVATITTVCLYGLRNKLVYTDEGPRPGSTDLSPAAETPVSEAR
ncbi:MHS family MFS transporter [Spiractinospora alimapuensis]|uniref:MFS transporter n=1 Tax=Spiractinospora alimapuensis TaxID=2820884 RepID=UPI001F2134F8|nr:MFS transporter [Spiractinospora alimapuensis]QVQ53820.1 MHS family MFS transporter [Spiractinospora alimapuensis]